MRLLLISSGLKPDHFGGLPSHVEDVLRALVAAGVEVGYLNVGAKAPTTGTTLTRRTDLPCPAWNLVSRWAHTQYWTGTLEPLAQVHADPAFRRAFAAVLEEFRPQLVHFHELTSFPLDAADELAPRGINAVFSAHDFYAVCPTVKLQRRDGTNCTRATAELDCDTCAHAARFNRALHWEQANDRRLAGALPLRNLGRRVIRACETTFGRPAPRAAYVTRRQEFAARLAKFDAVLATSRDQMQRLGVIAGAPLPLHYLPLTRATFRATPPPARTAPAQSGKLTFLALNIVNPAKGLRLLEDAFAELTTTHPQAELQLYGLAADSGAPNIRKLGPYDDSRLDEIIGGADFGLLPSIWAEAYGYVGPEMLSRGLPVVASNLGAMPDYVVDGANGLLFDPHTPGALAATLRRVLDDASLRAALWRGATETPRRYLTLAEHVAQLTALYERLLAGTPVAATAR